jgi:hypothetical protein
MKNKLRLFSTFIVILTFPLAAAASINVDPSENFGDVELGTSATAIITIQNVGFTPITLDSIALEPPSGDFAIIANPVGTTLANGESADVVITFTPTVLGPATATLAIAWMNGEAGTDTVELTGTGVESSGDPVTVQDLLDFFDQSVADGTLVGYGPGSSADGRRKALRNKIRAAGDTIEDGGDACEQLLDAYHRCDGLPSPPDFVAGQAAGTLAGMVLNLMDDLGCQ